MTNLLGRIKEASAGGGAGAGSRAISTIEDYAAAVSMWNPYGPDLYLGAPLSPGVSTTYGQERAEEINRTFMSYAQQAYQQNGIIFSCMLARASVFSSARFRWQRLRNGKASDTFGNSDLGIFERPWVGGTTQDLLTRMIQDADLAGNAFVTRLGGELVRMRPDWVDVVVARREHRGGVLGYRKVGFLYYEGGREAAAQRPELTVPFFPEEVCHFMPTPDPTASYRGMSWLTPVIRELQADALMTTHRRKFFENGATPNLVIKHAQQASPEKVERFAQRMADQYGGVENAYRSLNLYPGADVTVVGSDFRQIDFRQVQGAGETRIAAAAGVPPIVAGFSEGLQAATYSNYGQARRRFADGTVHPLWQNVAGSMELLAPRPGNFGTGDDVRLWYDVEDVPFLREDAMDASEIAFKRSQTIRQYVDAGFTPASAIAAVDAGDERLLEHTGLFSVQLQKPGTEAAPGGGAAPPAEAPAEEA